VLHEFRRQPAHAAKTGFALASAAENRRIQRNLPRPWVLLRQTLSSSKALALSAPLKMAYQNTYFWWPRLLL